MVNNNKLINEASRCRSETLEIIPDISHSCHLATAVSNVHEKSLCFKHNPPHIIIAVVYTFIYKFIFFLSPVLWLSL